MYDRYADDIFRYLLVHVRDRELAEDLTADAFMKAWKAIDKFDFSQPRPWLYKIAQNLLTDHWRRKQTLPLEHEEELASTGSSIEEDLDKQFDRKRMQALVRRLPEPMCSVVTMRFMLGYSARKTAESLQLTEENVRVIQYRALRKLRGYLS